MNKVYKVYTYKKPTKKFDDLQEYIDVKMGQKTSLVSNETFRAPPCSYDDSLPHLTFIREKGAGRFDQLIPLLKIEPKNMKYILIYSHSQCQDLGIVHDFCVDLSESLAVLVLCYDYPGYGMNTRLQDFSINCVYQAITCVYQYARKYKKSILLYGSGVGSEPTKWLAEQYRLPAMYHSPCFQAQKQEIVHENKIETILSVAQKIMSEILF